jgi:triosephosphate isomerase
MKALVVANWKMNPATMREAKKLFDATKKIADKAKKSTIIVAPPVVFLRELSSSYRGSRVSFAAQNAHFEAHGAHTGETSLAQFKDARAKFVIVGHAERRMAGETNEDTAKKVAAALSLKMTPILCVGESRRTEDGEQFDVVREQLRAGLASVAPSGINKVLLVYEPLWTIGASTTMNPRDMHQMAIFMRKCVVETHGEGGRLLKILYGGSVDDTNAAAMLKDGDVHGFLIGRAGLDAAEFGKLVASLEDAA